MKRLKTITITLILIFATPLLAHRVKLTNGRSVYGTIIGQNRKAVRIRVRGRVRVIPKSRIAEIDYSAKVPRRRRARRRKPVRAVAARRVVKPKREPRRVREPDLINKWTVTGRSALLPGWGHYNLGDVPMSLVYAGSFTAAFLYANNLRSSVRAAQTGYETSTLGSFVALEQRRVALAGASQTDVETLLLNVLVGAENFRPYNDQLTKYNRAVQILGLLYIGQVVHAYLDGSAMHGKAPGRLNDQSTGSGTSKATTELDILPDFGNSVGHPGRQAAAPGYALRLGARWRF